MPLFQVNCPGCHKPTLLGANGQCLIIEAPDARHADFRLHRDEREPEKLLFTYDPVARSGQRIVPPASGS